MSHRQFLRRSNFLNFSAIQSKIRAQRYVDEIFYNSSSPVNLACRILFRNVLFVKENSQGFVTMPIKLENNFIQRVAT